MLRVILLVLYPWNQQLPVMKWCSGWEEKVQEPEALVQPLEDFGVRIVHTTRHDTARDSGNGDPSTFEGSVEKRERRGHGGTRMNRRLPQMFLLVSSRTWGRQSRKIVPATGLARKTSWMPNQTTVCRTCWKQRQCPEDENPGLSVSAWACRRSGT